MTLFILLQLLHFELRDDASLYYMQKKGQPSDKHVLDLKGLTLHRVPVGHEILGTLSDVAVRVTCKKDGIDTEFRCVFPEAELMHFLDAIPIVSPHSNNLKEFKREMKWDKGPEWLPVEVTRADRVDPCVHSFLEKSSSTDGHGDPKQLIIQQSVMRRAITTAMDHYDKASRKLQTIRRSVRLVTMDKR